MGTAPRLPKPTVVIRTSRATFRFYHADALACLTTFPARIVNVIVTSPPYNLGVRYRSYDDTLPSSKYLQWTSAWVSAAARVLSASGSLFLNVGTKPTRPWTAIEVAHEAGRHLELQNTIHWIKSIVIEQDAAGTSAALDRDLAVGH